MRACIVTFYLHQIYTCIRTFVAYTYLRARVTWFCISALVSRRVLFIAFKDAILRAHGLGIGCARALCIRTRVYYAFLFAYTCARARVRHLTLVRTLKTYVTIFISCASRTHTLSDVYSLPRSEVRSSRFFFLSPPPLSLALFLSSTVFLSLFVKY